MAQRTVTGTILKPDGTPWATQPVRFRLRKGGYMTGGTQYPPADVTATTEADGTFEVSLWANEDGESPTEYLCTLPGPDAFAFMLPSGVGSVDLSTLRAG